jgi:hypothetical protein
LYIFLYLFIPLEDALLVSQAFQATLRAQDEETADRADGDEELLKVVIEEERCLHTWMYK